MSGEDNAPIQVLDKDNELVEYVELRRNKQAWKEKVFGLDFVVYIVKGSQKTTCYHIAFSLHVKIYPLTFEVAMKSQDVAFWNETIQDEIYSILENHNWILVDLPSSSKLIGCKWIFNKKIKVYGTIDKFKTKLVVKRVYLKIGYWWLQYIFSNC